MYLTKIKCVLFMLFMGIGLAACGDDSGKASSPAKASAPTAGSGSSMPAMEESGAMSAPKALEDNGVVYEEEIYKNWPYQ